MGQRCPPAQPPPHTPTPLYPTPHNTPPLGTRHDASISPTANSYPIPPPDAGEERDPATVVVGDLLTTPLGPAPVERIERVVEAGAFHPVVAGGSYYVDGILASDYNAHVPMFALVRTYFTLRYHIGVPVVPEGVREGTFSFFPPASWHVQGDVEHARARFARAAINAPLALQCLMYPTLIFGTVLTELVHIAAAHPVELAAAAALAMVSRTARKALRQ